VGRAFDYVRLCAVALPRIQYLHLFLKIQREIFTYTHARGIHLSISIYIYMEREREGERETERECRERDGWNSFSQDSIFMTVHFLEVALPGECREGALEPWWNEIRFLVAVCSGALQAPRVEFACYA
jgi:hypothetical protein